MKLAIRKFSLWERAILLWRHEYRLAWDGFMFYSEEPGWKVRDPVHPTKIVGQILWSDQLTIDNPTFHPVLTNRVDEEDVDG